MIAIDMRPYSVIDSDGFRELIKVMDGRYSIPSRWFFSEKVIPEIYSEVKDAIKIDLSKALPGISFTTDMWRSHQNIEYMVVTFHWTTLKDEMFQRRQALVSLEEFAEKATSKHIRDRLTAIANEWVPANNQLLFGSSDNGANIRRALIDCTKENMIRGWVPCIAHCLNLVMKGGIDTQRAVGDTISALRTLVSKVNNSQPVKRRFDELLGIHYPNTKHVKLTRDVETRWNSTLTMLENITSQRDAVEALANDRVMTPFADFSRPRAFQHWSDALDIISRVVAALKPAEEAIKLASQDDCSVSSFLPMVKGLAKQLQLLQDAGEVTGVISMVETFQNLWEKRMRWMMSPKPTSRIDYLEEETIIATFHAATVLDPRYKMKFAPRDEIFRNKIKEAISTSVVGLSDNEKNLDDVVELSDPDTPEQATQLPSHSDRPSFMSAMEAAMMESSPSTSENEDETPAQSDIKKSIAHELEVYLQQPVAKLDSNVLEYWSSRRQTFPNLAPVAAAYHACPPSSVTAERMFSVAGDIVTKKRCSLTPHNLQRLAMIKVNKNYIE
ncbi:zinc finger BED domain-containing protein 4-like [Lytechinus variegatus]|uniref:zinc finger BED domain-containing protein 4-like n=1 Tax=Lytechinus variegatus TaxID=7654 RepID=UPI001BB14233|nr:zinc finger BED domain-containing protein 4-like [Lytechinus variegatus]